jgi:putative endonuclease
MLFYVYILESKVDNNRYVEFTTDIRRRLEEHKQAKSVATKYRLPMKLIYSELCTNEQDARRREKYFKTTDGRRFLAKRLKSYYQSQ